MALSSSECYLCQTGFLSDHATLPDSAIDLIRPAQLRFDYPLPYGAIVHEGGAQFVVFSRSATAMRVLLYEDVNSPSPTKWSISIPI